MNTTIQTNQSIPTARTLNDRSRLRVSFHLIACAVLGLGLSPHARAVSPAPDGGYSGANTAEGDFALNALSTGSFNTALGFHALFANTTGNSNTAVGGDVMTSNTSGHDNTALGVLALDGNTTGSFNTANGLNVLQQNTTGNSNTANGQGALFSNTTGSNNTANGRQALEQNTTANDNVATGFHSLRNNTTGALNTATGTNALISNTTSNFNTADGGNSLFNNTTGAQNTATGVNALFTNTTSSFNTGTGVNSLFHNTTGTQETATGNNALFSNTTGNFNTAHGVNALYHNTTGSSNIALGNAAGFSVTTGSNNIDIGNQGAPSDAGAIRIGNSAHQATFIAGISGKTVPGGVGVVIDGAGHLGTMTSSARFKQNIKPMEQASEAILALTPVTFHYNQELDPAGIPQFGLVAEQVEKVDPDLVARDEQGKPYTVRYEAVNAMLLNEFLKEHRTVQEQQSTISEMKKQIEALTEGLHRVSDQLGADNRNADQR